MTTDNRTPIQNEAFKKLFKYNNLLLRWGTGTGKTVPAIYACNRLIEDAEPGYPQSILIFVAETSHKENWRKEFIKFLGKERSESVLRYVTIECYASMKKYADTEWDLIIFDECHHLQSEKRREVLETMESNYVLALSATPGKAALDALEHSFGRFKIDEISLQNAIDKEYLSEPKITIIPLELERFQRTQEIEMRMSPAATLPITDIWSNRWKYLKNKRAYARNILRFRCTEKEKYDYINEQFEYWKKQYFHNQNNIRLKNNWLQWGSKRKRYLGELKTSEALALVDNLKKHKRRFICFCTSILQADVVGKMSAVHSENSKSLELIQRFNNRQISSLFAVGMLVEGQNLTSLDDAVIIQLDGNERQFIQKMGRGMRSDSPHIYIFCYKNTRDEEYLQKALGGINQDYIEIKET